MDVNPLTHGTDWGVPDTDGSRTRRARRGRVAAAFSAMAGQAPPRPPVLHIISATLALMVPLIIGGPDLPLAQPRNVILGHLIGGGIGLLLSLWFGGSALAGGVAAGLAFGAMLLLRSAHSPGAATAMLLVTIPPAVPWRFMLVLMASAVIVITAGLVANRARRLRYPAYWW